MTDNYFQSNEFRRFSGNVTDSGIKLFFKYLMIAVTGLFSFLGEMFKMIVGK